MSEELPQYRPRCRFINCKAMQVHGEGFESDPDYLSGTMEFWCECTSGGVGPDGDGVGIEECKDPARECFREY